ALSRVLLAGDPALLRGDAEIIAAESGGSPLFVHELARHVRYSGAAPAEDAASEPPSSAPPLSLRNVLATRIGWLSREARRLLVAIVIAGRPIPYEIICRAAAGEGRPR